MDYNSQTYTLVRTVELQTLHKVCLLSPDIWFAVHKSGELRLKVRQCRRLFEITELLHNF